MNDTTPATAAPLHRRARLIRQREGWSKAQVAAALGVAEGTYTRWEAGDDQDIDEWVVRQVLAWAPISRADEVVGSSSRASLQAAWAFWGPEGGAGVQALSAVSAWVRVDDLIDHIARRQDGPDCVAARGVPEAGGSIFCAASLPHLQFPAVDGEIDYAERGRQLAFEAAAAWAQEPGDSFDPWTVADRFGIPVGRAHLGQDLFTATVRVGAGAAVVVNCDLSARWQRQGLTHALVHLAAGHVLSCTQAPIADESDDSIYACTAMAWRVCTLADHVTAWLLDPATAAADEAERRRIDAQLDAGTWPGLPADPDPGPVLADGEEPGTWHQEEVFVPPVQLRTELGLPNAALLEPGTGQDTWPAALVRRWVAAQARGRWLGTGTQDTRAFPFGDPGCPTISQVETALHQGRVVQAQLAQANRRATRSLFDDLD